MQSFDVTPPRRARRGLRWALAVVAVLVVLAVIGAFTIPLDSYFVYVPGPIRNVENLVHVKGAKTYPSQGSLSLTTVRIDQQPTLFALVQAGLDPKEEVVSVSSLGGNQSQNQLEHTFQVQMRESKRAAVETALGQLGYPPATGKGAKVVATIAGFGAKGKIKSGEIITAIDGHHVGTACRLDSYMSTRKVGQVVHITLRSGDKTRHVTVKTQRNTEVPGGHPLIGVEITTAHYHFDPGVQVSVDTGDIGGPSAGNMMALAIYDRLTPGDLTKGWEIAGTGTIDSCHGKVGPIGGVEEKVAAAEAKGMQIFLTPTADAADARKVANDIRIVPINSFSQALSYLENLHPHS